MDHETRHSSHNSGHSSHQQGFQLDYHAILLFKPFEIQTIPGLVLACFVVLFAAIIYDGFRIIRTNIFLKSKDKQMRNRKMITISHAFQSCVYILEFIWGYCLMLVVMTFNIWLFISLVIGTVIGFQMNTIFNKQSHLQTATSRNGNINKQLTKENALLGITNNQQGQNTVTANGENVGEVYIPMVQHIGEKLSKWGDDTVVIEKR